MNRIDRRILGRSSTTSTVWSFDCHTDFDHSHAYLCLTVIRLLYCYCISFNSTFLHRFCRRNNNFPPNMFFSQIRLLTILILFLPTLISSEPLRLTDKTWKDMLCGQWMVEL